jgi:hypothetical protein
MYVNSVNDFIPKWSKIFVSTKEVVLHVLNIYNHNDRLFKNNE